MKFNKEELVKSPLNYTGGKFKLLPQILPLFPDEINTFVDLFGGGFNVGVNVNAKKIVYNEYNRQVYEIIKGIKNSDIFNFLNNEINRRGLTKENKEAFLLLREEYNKSELKDWRLLYLLILYGFNNQIRFNKKGEYNIPFGYRIFNLSLKEKFIKFQNKIKDINCIFSNKTFEELKNSKLEHGDLVYCDPPYLITLASYNEQGGWNEDTEIKLLIKLDELNSSGIKFALSNVLEHKGRSNDILKNWSNKYNVHHLDYDYNNCSYQGKNTDNKTTEVLITNY